MKFSLDTDHYEDLRLLFSESDYNKDVSDVIEEFCFAMASFFVDLSMKLNCDVNQAASLKGVCLPCIGGNIDLMLKRGVLKSADDEPVSEAELDALMQGMKANGFSREEIETVVRLVKDRGSLEAAKEYLKRIVEDKGAEA